MLATVLTVACCRPVAAAPQLGYAYPAGGQRGTTFTVEVGGQSLQHVDAVRVSGRGVRAAVVEYARPLDNNERGRTQRFLRELRRAGLDVLGVLFCETTPTEWGTIERDNRHTIERRGQVRILGNVPYMPGLADGRVSPEEFLDIVSQSVTWDGT